MKHRNTATRPTRAQKKQIAAAGLDPKDWRVLSCGTPMEIIHKHTGEKLEVDK